MSKKILVTSTSKLVDAQLTLTGSKSISNRVLLIRALTTSYFDIFNLSTSDDTKAMLRLLDQNDGVYDAGHAGTTFRFLTAYFAFKSGEQILTGSDRMKQRPISALVEALRDIGANIQYLDQDGFAPLLIKAPNEKISDTVTIPATISSQYISALIMIAPTLASGLNIKLEGSLVSRPYLQMTLDIVGEFGIAYSWDQNVISIKPQAYQAKDYFVEADWSSASYLYAWASAMDEAQIVVEGLTEKSLQGDSAIRDIATLFGVTTTFHSLHQLSITKQRNATKKEFIEYDFINQPDIAQTVFAMCALHNVKGLFTGLQTLYIKETDRIGAYKKELEKIGVNLNKVPSRFYKKNEQEHFMLDGDIQFESTPEFDTYHDHRMALSLAPLSILHPIVIKEPDVVSKSYPDYWEDLKKFGIITKQL